MNNNSPEHLKHEQLRMHGCLNPHPDAVSDELFGSDRFFDPHDLPQVKYEMLRRVQHDKRPVSGAAASFGFSRVAFYQAQHAFDNDGLCGLLPRKRGPKDRHKLTARIMEFIRDTRSKETIGPVSLAQRIKDDFGIVVHPRSIQRALAAQKKKLPGTRADCSTAG